MSLEKDLDSESIEERGDVVEAVLSHPMAPYVAGALIALSYLMPGGKVAHYLNDRRMEEMRSPAIEYLLFSKAI